MVVKRPLSSVATFGQHPLCTKFGEFFCWMGCLKHKLTFKSFGHNWGKTMFTSQLWYEKNVFRRVDLIRPKKRRKYYFLSINLGNRFSLNGWFETWYNQEFLLELRFHIFWIKSNYGTLISLQKMCPKFCMG